MTAVLSVGIKLIEKYIPDNTRQNQQRSLAVAGPHLRLNNASVRHEEEGGFAITGHEIPFACLWERTLLVPFEENTTGQDADYSRSYREKLCIQNVNMPESRHIGVVTIPFHFKKTKAPFFPPTTARLRANY